MMLHLSHHWKFQRVYKLLHQEPGRKKPNTQFLMASQYHSPTPPIWGVGSVLAPWTPPQGEGGGWVGEGRCLGKECSKYGVGRHKCGAEEGLGLFPPEPRLGAGRLGRGWRAGRPLRIPCVWCVNSCSPLDQPPAHPKKPRARGFASITADPIRGCGAQGGALPWQHRDLGGGDGNQGCF